MKQILRRWMLLGLAALPFAAVAFAAKSSLAIDQIKPGSDVADTLLAGNGGESYSA